MGWAQVTAIVALTTSAAIGCADDADTAGSGDPPASSTTMSPSTTTSLVPDPLPPGDRWLADNPQPAAGEVLHLIVDFSVDDGFEPVGIEVSIDRETVVSGAGAHRPDQHCNFYGPYDVVLEAGSHTVAVTTGDGIELNESFGLDRESTAIANYTHPTYSGRSFPTVSWDVFDGEVQCA